MNLLHKIKDVLKKHKIESYYPGQHKGECLEPYVVIKQSGSIDANTVSSEWILYDIMCYVPKDNYSFLEEYVYKVKQSMKEMFPLLFYAGNQTESYYDESVNGHMVSFQYQNVRRKTNWK